MGAMGMVGGNLPQLMNRVLGISYEESIAEKERRKILEKLFDGTINYVGRYVESRTGIDFIFYASDETVRSYEAKERSGDITNLRIRRISLSDIVDEK